MPLTFFLFLSVGVAAVPPCAIVVAFTLLFALAAALVVIDDRVILAVMVYRL